MIDIDYSKAIPETTEYIENKSYVHSKTSGESFFLIIVLTTILAGAGNLSVADFKICGWAWAIVLLISLGYLFLKRQQPFSAIWFAWAPFFIYVLFRSDMTNKDDLQRFAILLTPVLAGMAVSSLRFGNIEKVQRYFYILLYLTTANYLVAFIQTGESNGFTTWNIPHGFCMTLTLTAIAGVVDWARGIKRGLHALGISYLICFLTVSRMPILTIPFLMLFGPFTISRKKKVGIAIFLCLAAIYAFTLQPVRENIFRKHSGLLEAGTYRDVIELDPAVVSSGGRLTAWPYYFDMIKERPFWGYGGTATVKFGNFMFGGWSHPHNDYIRLLFDYGIVGLILYLSPYVLLLIKCYRRIRFEADDVRWLYRVSAGGLLAGLILMITGNAMMYVAWFGNLLFATIGAAFSATKPLLANNQSQPDL